jgi:hypothetical protein
MLTLLFPLVSTITSPTPLAPAQAVEIRSVYQRAKPKAVKRAPTRLRKKAPTIIRKKPPRKLRKR